MVRLRRLELPRGINPTATSTLRVYQFRHSRTGERQRLEVITGWPLDCVKKGYQTAVFLASHIFTCRQNRPSALKLALASALMSALKLALGWQYVRLCPLR